MPPKTDPLRPSIRFAPIGEPNVYGVYECVLDLLEKGSAGSDLLSSSYALLPFSGAFVIARLSTEIPDDSVYILFVLTALVAGLAGAICLRLGAKNYRSNGELVAEIKRRMPPVNPLAEPTPVGELSGGS